MLAPCREAGATISVNHPFCSMCGFHMDLEHFHFDCVEVWNTIQHSDNIKNMNWWHNQLLQGNHIAAVGGSDFHKDIGPLKLLAPPPLCTPPPKQRKLFCRHCERVAPW